MNISLDDVNTDGWMCITVYVLYYALCNNFWVTIIQIIKFPKVWLAFTLVEILVRILEDPTSILTKILPQDLRILTDPWGSSWILIGILKDPDWDPQGSCHRILEDPLQYPCQVPVGSSRILMDPDSILGSPVRIPSQDLQDLCFGPCKIEKVPPKLQSWSKVLGWYQFPPSPESVHNGHLLTPTLIRGEGGSIP